MLFGRHPSLGETCEVFMKRLKKVLEKVKDAGPALASKKCQFGVTDSFRSGKSVTWDVPSKKAWLG